MQARDIPKIHATGEGYMLYKYFIKLSAQCTVTYKYKTKSRKSNTSHDDGEHGHACACKWV